MSWLPDVPARRSKARQTAQNGDCMRCWLTEVRDDADDSTVATVIPFPLKDEQKRGRPVSNQRELDDLIETGEPWIEVVSTAVALVVAWVPDSCRVDIAPGAKAIVAGAGPVVRSWGHARAAFGGRVAGGPGSRTVLTGGQAAVSTGGALVAEEGLGVVDAGSRLTVPQGAQDVGVYALPGSVIVAGAQASVTTERPWGVLVTEEGVIGQAEADPDIGLSDMLELARTMGTHPGL